MDPAPTLASMRAAQGEAPLVGLPIVASDPSAAGDGPALVAALLQEQQRTTAVEQFARRSPQPESPAQAKHYRDLIPVAAPGGQEQYAFEVNLDACSGCKACVTACHRMNGLEEGEVWRQVGLLHGGTSEAPVLQHVTTACHHCIEPACLQGCPVKAYEKDPLTGIVRHLDDQCIGCQYCMLKCPYDVPQYSKSKGIVRKCDMCHDRLAAGEAPACVQACPNRAIRITIVNHQRAVEESEANVFLPGAPEPGYTIPTTVYKSNRAMPRNLLPGDYYSARPQHSHWPLVVMLVLTQMSVGAFCVEQFLRQAWFFSADAGQLAKVRSVHLPAALLMGVLGIGASVFHLGRPQYAFRAVIGLGSSWLSREIVAFGLFAGLASVYVAAAFTQPLARSAALHSYLGAAAALAGLVAMACSIMIYVDTQRAFWSPLRTTIKFLGTALVLGIPVALLVSLAAAALFDELTIRQVLSAYGWRLCQATLLVAAGKLLFEGLALRHLRERRHTPLKRTALLMTGDLGITTALRFFFGLTGGVLLPLILLGERQLAAAAGFDPLFIGAAAVLTLLLLLLGEFCERYLFFTAVVAPKMPGGQG